MRDGVAARWLSADAFYTERDDRTVRAVGNLHAYVHRPVEIVVEGPRANEMAVQVMALVAANLTARWARHVRFVVSTDVALAVGLRRDGMTTIAERVAREMAMADPFGRFVVTEDRSRDVEVLRLFVGGGGETGDDYSIDALGWTALGRRGRFPLSSGGTDATVAAAGLAGALGASDLFKRAIGHARERWMPTFAWDTWSSRLALDAAASDVMEERPVPMQLELGNTLLAGVGAIGSAWVYLAEMMLMRGALTLFDRDRIDVTNLNRSPMFTVLHAMHEMLKTTAALEYLARHAATLALTPAEGVWREHSARFGREPFDVWISLTNEDGAWAEVPFQLPPVVLHATTTSGWGFGAGRHIPRVEDCTLCRMPRPEAKTRMRCAEGDVAVAVAEPVRASLPFLSTAAAALLLASQLQLQAGAEAVELPNDISVDVGSGLPSLISLWRGPTASCRGCVAVRSRAWETRGGRGRFAGHSRKDGVSAQKVSL